MTLQNTPELVVLVDDQNQPIGTALKSEVHTNKTPLHRGFSVFLFNSKNELLLQQRSSQKKTWPLVWSNSCCGHPLPDENILEAAKRRIKFELNIKEVKNLSIKIPNYRYKFERDGVVENEICPILTGFLDSKPQSNPHEVESFKWIKWQDFLKIAKDKNPDFSEWSLQEALLLDELGFAPNLFYTK